MSNTLIENLNEIQRQKDEYIIPENIKSGVTVMGVTGELEGGIDTSDATAVANEIENGKTAYVNGSKITGNLQSSQLDFLMAESVGYDDSGATPQVNIGAKFNNKVIKPANSSIHIDAEFFDVANVIGLTGNKIASGQRVGTFLGTYTNDANATASDILQNKTAYVNGQKITGTLVPSGGSTVSGNSIYVDTFTIFSGGGGMPSAWVNNSSRKRIVFNSPVQLTSSTQYYAFIAPYEVPEEWDDETGDMIGGGVNYARYLILLQGNTSDTFFINDEYDRVALNIDESGLIGMYRYADVSDFGSLTDGYGWNELPTQVTNIEAEPIWMYTNHWTYNNNNYTSYKLSFCLPDYDGYFANNIANTYQSGDPTPVHLDWDIIPTNYVKSGTKYLTPTGARLTGTLNLSNANFPAVAGCYVDGYAVPDLNRNSIYHTKLPTGLDLNNKRWAIIQHHLPEFEDTNNWLMVSDYDLPIYVGMEDYYGLQVTEDSNVTWYRTYTNNILVGTDYTVLDSIVWQTPEQSGSPIGWHDTAIFDSGEVYLATNSAVTNYQTGEVVLCGTVRASDLPATSGYLNIQGKFIQGTA